MASAGREEMMRAAKPEQKLCLPPVPFRSRPSCGDEEGVHRGRLRSGRRGGALREVQRPARRSSGRQEEGDLHPTKHQGHSAHRSGFAEVGAGPGLTHTPISE